MAYALEQSFAERQPPLYYGLLTVWRQIDKSLFFARLFSIMCIALTILVVADLWRMFVKDTHPAWIGLLLGVNPYAIWAAVEARGYALVVLLSGLMALAFIRAYTPLIQGSSWRRVYVLVSVLAAYTYYPLGFLMLANGLTLVILRRWKALRMYVLDMLAAAVMCTPLLAYILTLAPEVVVGPGGNETWPSLVYAIRAIKWRVQEYVLSAYWRPLLQWRDWIVSLGPLVAVAVALMRRKSLFTCANVSIFMMCLVASVGFAGLYYLTQGYIEYRHGAPLLVPAILTVCVVIAHIARWKSLLVWTCVSLVFNISALVVKYEPMSKHGDWDRVAQYIQEYGDARIPILVFVSFQDRPFRYAYSGANPIVPIPKPFWEETGRDHGDWRLHDEGEIFRAISRLPGKVAQVWLVTWDSCGYRGVKYNCEIMEEFVGKYAVVEQERAFWGSKARLLRLKEMPGEGWRKPESS